MIFVTVGSVFPFDRMIAAADAWAAQTGVRTLAQIGRSTYSPRALEVVQTMPLAAYREAVTSSEIVVAHAGMGSIMTAAECNKAIVVMPRRKDLGEHNTDHQLDTAQWMRDRPGVFVAMDEGELGDRIAAARAVRQAAAVPLAADREMIARLKARITDYLGGQR